MATIVVGIDGSPASAAALAWAAAHARQQDATLKVVTVYRPSDDPNPHDVSGAAGEGGGGHLADTAQRAADWRDEHDRHERQRAHGRIDRMVGELDNPPAQVVPVVATGRKPAKALLEAAQGADMLVVGSRGRGGFTGLMLGSVSQQLAGHAPCPLLIVRDPDEIDAS